MNTESIAEDTQYVVVARNRRGDCLATMGPYSSLESAQYVADDVRGGKRKGWRVEPFENQFEESRDYYKNLGERRQKEN